MQTAGEGCGTVGGSQKRGTCERDERTTQLQQEEHDQAAAALCALLELCACPTLVREFWGLFVDRDMLGPRKGRLHVLGGLQWRPPAALGLLPSRER
jgi:hypothetical protein